MTLADSLKLLEHYSVVILPALVVAEQVGIPLPAVPALLAVGALAASGRVSIPLVLGAIALVALTVDLGWYELGRRRGVGGLARLCRLSLEPDSCGRRTGKYVRRRLFLRALRIARIAPEALKSRLDAGEDVTIIDLRTRIDVAAMPYAIPGSRWMATDEIDEHQSEFLRSRELVLYCS